MSIFEKLTLRFQEKISGNHPKSMLGLLVKNAALEAKTHSRCNLETLSKINSLLLDTNIIPDSETTNISLKSWPAIAELLIAHGGRPSLRGFKNLAHQAKEYKKEIDENAYEILESGKSIPNWPWKKTTISLIEKYADGLEWYEAFNMNGEKPSSIIAWLGKMDIEFEDLLYHHRQLNGLPKYPRQKIPKSHREINNALYFAVNGLSSISSRPLDNTVRNEWLTELLQAGADPNVCVKKPTPGSHEEPHNAIALSILKCDEEALSILEKHGGKVGWNEIRYSITALAEKTLCLDNDKKKYWLLQVITNNLPENFDWNSPEHKIFLELAPFSGEFLSRPASEVIAPYQDQINSYYEYKKLNHTTPQIKSSTNKSRPTRL